MLFSTRLLPAARMQEHHLFLLTVMFLLYFGWFAFELNMIKTVYHLSNFHNLVLGKDGTFEL